MYNLPKASFQFYASHMQVSIDLLIDPGLTGCAIGKLNITKANTAQPTTRVSTSQPNLPKLEGLFSGRDFGCLDVATS